MKETFPAFEGLIGAGKPMEKVFELIEKVAKVDFDVLITGESGTGKDMVAHTIHRLSERAGGPFVPVNAGAISKDLVISELFGHEKGAFTGAAGKKRGKFEQASGGTLFLDEISTMDGPTQISLLRVLESKQFQRVGGESFINTDVRVIAATNGNLRRMVKQKQFRNDLYQRFNVLQIKLPPLYKRGNDIELLAAFFLRQYAEEFDSPVSAISKECMDYLKRYRWPGNVRELENLILKLVITCDRPTIEADMLPDLITRAKKRKSRVIINIGETTIEEAEREIIFKTLHNAGGNKKKAAGILGISRKALYNKLKEYEN